MKSFSEIGPPERSGLFSGALIVISLAVLGVRYFVEIEYIFIFTIFHAALLAAGLIKRTVFTVHLLVLCFLISLIYHLPASKNWPFYFLVPLILYGLIVWIIPWFRNSLDWLRPGKYDSRTLLLVILIVIISSTALVLWYILSQPDLSGMSSQVPDWSLKLLVLSAIGFSIINALMEEIIWRGAFQQALNAAFGVGFISIVIQALSFGMIHYKGFPSGLIGAALAAIYGLMLGYIRYYTRGLLWPIIAHFFADLTIFILYITYVAK